MGRIRTLLTWSSIPTLVASLLLTTIPVNADDPRTLVVGVDNNSPGKENWGFLDYYPRAGVKVHNGDVVGFRFTPPATSDQLHTATLGARGETAEQVAANPNYGIQPDFDDGFQLQFAPAAIAPSASGCGTQAHPCTYDGSTEVNSGLMCRAIVCPFSEYFVKLNVGSVPAGGLAIHYVCLIHGPVMQGTIDVVPEDAGASRQHQLDAAARAQYAPQIGAGFQAKADALRRARQTGTVMAGTEDTSGRVQILEMLPRNFKLANPGAVSWLSPSQHEIHTVTFPAGSGSDSVDPIPVVCEAGPPDAPLSVVGGVPCGNRSIMEFHANPQPQGAPVITSPSTVASSGIIATGAPPFPPGYAFNFPNSGTFTYQCRIHDHMVGTIRVGAANNGDGGDSEDSGDSE